MMIFGSYDSKSYAWEIRHFGDEFGEKTKERYIKESTTGVFSNSATKDSPLWVDLIVCPDQIGIFLYEYTQNRTAVVFMSLDGNTLMLRNSTGKTLQERIDTKRWAQNGGVGIQSPEVAKKVVSFLRGSKGTMKAVIYTGRVTTYSFTFYMDGFAEAYNELTKKGKK
jgi:hypothetical protein